MYNHHMEKLTSTERNRMVNLNKRNGWGFTKQQLQRILSEYIKASNNNEERKMGMIEYRLEDANFHTECNLLIERKFDEYKNMLSTWQTTN